jgi:hypothetical protein
MKPLFFGRTTTPADRSLSGLAGLRHRCESHKGTPTPSALDAAVLKVFATEGAVMLDPELEQGWLAPSLRPPMDLAAGEHGSGAHPGGPQVRDGMRPYRYTAPLY